MAYNYKLQNFVAEPTEVDKLIKLFTKDGKMIYTLIPNMAYFFYKNNLVIIRIDDQENIVLDFETTAIAIEALKKLNIIKSKIIDFNTDKSSPCSECNLNDLANIDIDISTLNNESFLKYDNSISGWTSFELELSSTTFTSESGSTITVGGIESGSTFDFETMSDMWTKLLYPLILPTYTREYTTICGVTHFIEEVGASISFQLDYTFNRGMIDSKNNYQDIFLVGEELDISSNGHTFHGPGVNPLTGLVTDGIIEDGENEWNIVVVYTGGTGDYYDSKGDSATNLDYLRVNGNTSASATTMIGDYKQWWGSSTSEMPSGRTDVRALTNTAWTSINEIEINITLGHKYVSWYKMKDKDTGLKEVLLLGIDITNDITMSEITVNNANGDGVQYNKYSHYIGGIGYDIDTTYYITY